jgi:large subunit ribosomal protein L3
MGTELIGKKVGMTQVFDAGGNFVGVTVVEVTPCTVLQKKTVESDGYRAFQIGAGLKKKTRSTKPLAGHCKKAGAEPVQRIREFRADDGQELNVGDKISVAEFQPGQFVDVIGTCKGHGFQGVVKRHHFRGGDASHGSKGWHRRSGAIGQRMTPGRVFPGKRMPGHMGDVRVTVQNLKVIQVRADQNLIFVEGALPGARGAWVVIRHAKKKRKPAAKAT